MTLATFLRAGVLILVGSVASFGQVPQIEMKEHLVYVGAETTVAEVRIFAFTALFGGGRSGGLRSYELLSDGELGAFNITGLNDVVGADAAIGPDGEIVIGFVETDGDVTINSYDAGGNLIPGAFSLTMNVGVMNPQGLGLLFDGAVHHESSLQEAVYNEYVVAVSGNDFSVKLLSFKPDGSPGAIDFVETERWTQGRLVSSLEGLDLSLSRDTFDSFTTFDFYGNDPANPDRSANHHFFVSSRDVRLTPSLKPIFGSVTNTQTVANFCSRPESPITCPCGEVQVFHGFGQEFLHKLTYSDPQKTSFSVQVKTGPSVKDQQWLAEFRILLGSDRPCQGKLGWAIEIPDDVNAAGMAIGTVRGADRRVLITESDGSTNLDEREPGLEDTYTVVLDSAPTGNVDISFEFDDQQITIDPATLEFATDNWQEPQTVTVRVVDDELDEIDQFAHITHSASGGGYDDTIIPILRVTIVDDDTPFVEVTRHAAYVQVTEKDGGAREAEVKVWAFTALCAHDAQSQFELTQDSEIGGFVKPVTGDIVSADAAIGPDGEIVIALLSADGDLSFDFYDIDGNELDIGFDDSGLNVDFPNLAGLSVTFDDENAGMNDFVVAVTGSRVVEETCEGTRDVEKGVKIFSLELNGDDGIIAVDDPGNEFPKCQSDGRFDCCFYLPDYTSPLDCAVIMKPRAQQTLSDILLYNVFEDDLGNHKIVAESFPRINDCAGASMSPVGSIEHPCRGPSRADVHFIGEVPRPEHVGIDFVYQFFGGGRPGRSCLLAAQASSDRGMTEFRLMQDEFGILSVHGWTFPTTGEILGVGLGVGIVDLPPAIRFSQSGGSTDLIEIDPGTIDTYEVFLDRRPSGPVTVELIFDDAQIQLESGPGPGLSPLEFNQNNWLEKQEVRVIVVDDGAGEGNHTTTITHNAFDANYSDVTADLIVHISEVLPGAQLTESDGSTDLDEADPAATDSYTVVLESEPKSGVEVQIAFDNTQVGVTPNPLTFDETNWDQAQTVTVTVVDDNFYESDHVSTITHSVSGGGGYDRVTLPDVKVRVSDDDAAPGAQLTESDGSTNLDEGNPAATDSYTVVLESEPRSGVEVQITFDDTQVDVTPNPLTFDATNWDQAQTVTVTVVDDDVDESEHFTTITHTVSGSGGFDAVSLPDVEVSISDDDAVPFRRGDGNDSGSVDFVDVIYNLFFQFDGSPEPGAPTCLDALDTDDSGAVDINDPVYSLTWQFLAGSAPPAPGPASCGLDPTDDIDANLGCLSSSCP